MGGARLHHYYQKSVNTQKMHSSMWGARFQVSCPFEVQKREKSPVTVLIVIMFSVCYRNSVPDSCCLFESPGCGSDLFAVNDLRVIFFDYNHPCPHPCHKYTDSGDHWKDQRARLFDGDAGEKISACN